MIYTRRTQAVEKIAVYIPVTEEQLEDAPQAAALIDQRLPFMVQQRLDSQIINGNGSTPNLLGVLSASNLQTQARGADPDPDAIEKAMTKVRVTGRAIPSAVVMHSNNMSFLRPQDSNNVSRIWGIPIVLCESIAAGTAVVGDFVNYSNLVEKRALNVQMGWINDYFLRGMKVVRADIRVAVVWTRGAAFCSVTGLQS